MDATPFPPVDRISSLPDNVMDDILTRLTLRDAAKTSILAKQWRCKWQNMPQLNFDCTLWPQSEGNEELARLKFVQILYRVLLCHQGPITKFTLNVQEFYGCSEIDPLINILWKNNIEDLTLKTKDLEEPEDVYTLSSTIFRCLKLKYLRLSFCAINPPPSFKGFTRLIRLELESVTIRDERLAYLISSCPLLEQLVLNIYGEPDRLEIYAPMLKLFVLKCDKVSIWFKESPLLAIVSVAANYFVEFGNQILNLDEFFNSIPALQELHMDCFLVWYFVKPKFQTKIKTFKNVKTLKLSQIQIGYKDILYAVRSLLRSCSNLEKLKIQILVHHLDDPDDTWLEEEDFSSVLLHHLHEVTLERFEGTFPEMTLIKFLLEKSPTLKRMVISSGFSKFDEQLVGALKKLNKFRRASQDAEVVFEDDIK